MMYADSTHFLVHLVANIYMSPLIHTTSLMFVLPFKVTIICRYIFSGFGILCILLVLNFAWASQLMIFMMVCSQYFIFTSIKFCAFV